MSRVVGVHVITVAFGFGDSFPIRTDQMLVENCPRERWISGQVKHFPGLGIHSEVHSKDSCRDFQCAALWAWEKRSEESPSGSGVRQCSAATGDMEQIAPSLRRPLIWVEKFFT